MGAAPLRDSAAGLPSGCQCGSGLRGPAGLASPGPGPPGKGHPAGLPQRRVAGTLPGAGHRPGGRGRRGPQPGFGAQAAPRPGRLLSRNASHAHLRRLRRQGHTRHAGRIGAAHRPADRDPGGPSAGRIARGTGRAGSDARPAGGNPGAGGRRVGACAGARRTRRGDSGGRQPVRGRRGLGGLGADCPAHYPSGATPMRGVQSRWPHPPAEPGDYSQRHLAEFSHVNDSLIDDEGLIEAFVLPLRDLVFFPNMVTPLFLDPDQAQSPVQDVLRGGETLIAITQRKLETAQPGPKDLYRLGTEIAVGRLQQNSDGGTSVLAQGRRRIEVVEYVSTEPLLRVRGRPILEPERRTQETAGLMRAVLGLFDTCVQLNRSLPEEAYVYALNIEQPGWLADLIASTLPLPISERQKVLEILDPVKRLNHVSELLRREVEVLELEDLIHNQVQSEVNRSQREDYLREQMKAIQTELGEGDLWTQELAELRKKIDEKALPEEVGERATREFQRLGQMPPLSPEVGIIRTYLVWILELPWKAGEEKTLDLRSAARTLNREHYGLRKAKDRILEYIAVRQLAGQKQRQPILCFVGPPGTGKTSLGKSIAKALGREFVRISLGGIRDE